MIVFIVFVIVFIIIIITTSDGSQFEATYVGKIGNLVCFYPISNNNYLIRIVADW